MWARAIILTVGVAMLLGGCGVPQMAPLAGHARETHVPDQASSATGRLLAAFEDSMDMVDEARFDQALVKLTEIEPLMIAVGDHQRAGLCLYWRGFCEEKLSRPAQAEALYRDVLSMYPDTVASNAARQRLDILNAPRD